MNNNDDWVHKSRYNILFSQLWAVSEVQFGKKRLELLLSKKENIFKILIENLILYDCIIIPTQDFLSLSALINIFGEQLIISLLENKCLHFVRRKGWIGYISNINNGGIQSFTGKPTFNVNPPSKDAAASLLSDSDDAINWALSSEFIGPLDSPREMAKKVLGHWSLESLRLHFMQ